jgi:hypothetical protein
MILRQIVKTSNSLNDGYAICAWHYPETEPLDSIRLELLSIVIIFSIDNVLKAIRLYSSSMKDIDGIWRIVFKEGLVRIKSGKRRNIVVPASNLKEDEEGVNVGLCKRLVFGAKGFEFSSKRQGDLAFLTKIESMLQQRIHKVTNLPTPAFYTVSKHPQRLIVRSNRIVLDKLTKMPEYSAYDSLRCNYTKVATALFPKNAIGYMCDYNMVFGGSMIVADASRLNSEVYKVKLDDMCINTTNEYCRIDLSGI